MHLATTAVHDDALACDNDNNARRLHDRSARGRRQICE